MSYRVCVNVDSPYEAPTMINTNGTPNKAGYLLIARFKGASLSGFEENTVIAHDEAVSKVEVNCYINPNPIIF